jgi:hypothetical protein
MIILALKVCLSLILLSPLTSLAEDRLVKLPEDTELPVLVTQTVSSGSSAVGQPIKAEIEKDILIDNIVVISKGTPVKAFVSQIEHAKRLGKGGSISVQINSVKAVDGQKVSLRSAMGRSGKDNTGATVAMTVLFGLPGLLVKGSEAGIRKNTVIKAYVDEELEIKSSNESIEKPKDE